MDTAALLVSCIMLLLGGGTFLLALLRGRGQYDEWLEPLNEKEFKMKSLLPAGLDLCELIHPQSLAPEKLRAVLIKYDNRVNLLLVEMYGSRENEFYRTIHNAERWVISLLAMVAAALFGLIFHSNGDFGPSLLIGLLAPVIGCLGTFLMDRQLQQKSQERRERIQLEFPEFINKLILLVNAGATIPRAWEKIASESRSNSPLYRELQVCRADIRAGKPEAQAYEEFARRCKVKEVIKMVSVIVLNLRKGGSEVIPALRVQADECWDARKAAAKRLGEKASSKLLFPMAIMLLGIIMIVALPAVLSLSGM